MIATRSPRRSASSMSWVTKHDRLARLAVDAGRSPLQRVAGDRIERAERLVHQQQLGIGGQRAGDADTLLLAARQLVRDIARDSSPGSSRSSSSSSSTRASMRGLGQPSRRGTVAMLSRDRPVRKEPGRLDHIADARGAASPARPAMSSPSIRIVPGVGRISRLIMCSVVDLPHPTGRAARRTRRART